MNEAASRPQGINTMLRHHTRHGLPTLAAVLALVTTTTAEDEPSPATPPVVDEVANETDAPDLLVAAATCLSELDAFEVVVSTIVRDSQGRRLAPPSRGRIAFERRDDAPRFLAETWGALGSARLAFDGETVTLGDPTSRAYESMTTPEDPARILDDPGITARFGPAAVHLLGLVLDDGLDAFRQIGEPRGVDLGPRPAMLVPCQSMLDETGGDVRMAFAASGPPLPLAVAVLLPDGSVVELEFHDWRLGPIEDAADQFAAPPAEWTRVASLPRPACLPAKAEPGAAVEMPTAIAEVDTLAE